MNKFGLRVNGYDGLCLKFLILQSSFSGENGYLSDYMLTCSGNWIGKGEDYTSKSWPVNYGCPTFGCTSSSSVNYNKNADINDGSCVQKVNFIYN